MLARAGCGCAAAVPLLCRCCAAAVFFCLWLRQERSVDLLGLDIQAVVAGTEGGDTMDALDDISGLESITGNIDEFMKHLVE